MATQAQTPSGAHDDHHYDNENDHAEEEAHENEEEIQEWDEGGPSHCGYSETVHETLMAVGKGVHTVVGEPSASVEQGVIKSVGNWFQEASYAVRDFVRGNKEVEDDASQTFNDMKESALTAIMGSEKQEGNTSNENAVPSQN